MCTLIFLLALYVPCHSGLVVAQERTGKQSESDAALRVQPSPEAQDSASQNTSKDQITAPPLKPAVADPEAAKEAVNVFWWVFRLITALLLSMFVVIFVCLFRSKWSLAEALSEESSVQPPATTQKGEVKTLASTSRLIALFGLMGILTIVLGVGYTIIWNLLLYQKPPDNLSEIRSFLLGASCLFAPYLANQLRAAFDGSPDTDGTSGVTKPKPTPPNPAPSNPTSSDPATPNPGGQETGLPDRQS
jgi:hypothetical protein